MAYEGSYVWEIRQLIGNKLLLVPAAVVTLLNSQGEVLLMRRSDTGHWALPGGSAEPGLSFLDTAVAELEEETGLSVDPESLEAFATVSELAWTHFVFPGGDEVHSFNLCFSATRWTGELQTTDEASAFTWSAPQSLPDPMLPMSRRVIEMLEEYRKHDRRFQAR